MAQALPPLKKGSEPMPRRRTLAFEITLSLVAKVAALAAISLLLFGTDKRPGMDAEKVGAALTGEQQQ